MSVQSDDTDVLLLIPPDFFLVPSDVEDDYCKTSNQLLFSDLISQVNDLEGRLCYIENQNTISEKMGFDNNPQQPKHFSDINTLGTLFKPNYNAKSLKLTFPKTQIPANLKTCKKSLNLSPEKTPKKNFRAHPNVLISREHFNKKKKDDTSSTEIKKFFKIKEALGKKINLFEECPEKEADGNLHLFSSVYNLDKVNDFLKHFDVTQMEIEEKLKLNDYIDIVEGNEVSNSVQNNIFNNYELLDNVTDAKEYIENENFNEELNIVSSKLNKSDTILENSKENLENSNDYFNKISLLEKNKNIVDENANNVKFSSELTKLPSLHSSQENNDVNKKSESVRISIDFNIVKQKYQEELCRRQHCEEIIQKLQASLLEQQQKLALAIKVDREKDKAISRLTEGYNKLVNNWKKLEKQSSIVENLMESEREKFEAEVTAACQTVKRYEAELSKALDLAHGYKEKCKELENEKKNKIIKSVEEIETLKYEIKYLREKFDTEKLKTEKLNKVIAGKEESLKQAKAKIIESINQIKNFEKKLKESETELELVKVEKENFYKKFNEECTKNSVLEQSKKILFGSNEELKKNERCLKENLKSLKEEIEKIKLESKEFYQKQVEQIVQEKLREFQDQLFAAEKTLQKDVEEREKKLKEMAVQQVQEIVEKHMVEVNILEEKHREEIELWKVKVIQSEEKANELLQKLSQHTLNKSEIAQKLQSVMEAQWQEALKIITASSPNGFKKPINCNKNYTLEKSSKTLSRQNTFTTTANVLADKNFPEEIEKISALPSKESAFCRDGQICLRNRSACHSDAIPHLGNETPQKKVAAESDSLRNYIRMLLERPPYTPADKKVENNQDDDVAFDTSQFCTIKQWQQILSQRSNENNKSSDKKKFFK